MAYADLVADASYRTKKTGAQLEIVLVLEDDPTDAVIGAASGINCNESYETVPVEEAGNDGVDEIAQGRHRGSCSLSYFWTPARGDSLPTRQSFIGKSYAILIRIGVNQPLEGTVVDAFVGCVVNANNSSVQARGARMGDLSFDFTRRFSGGEWAAAYGS